MPVTKVLKKGAKTELYLYNQHSWLLYVYVGDRESWVWASSPRKENREMT